MFHSHVPASSPSQLQRKKLRWLSPESQGPSRASPSPTGAPRPTVPVPCAGPVVSPPLGLSPEQGLAVPRVSHTEHPCFGQGKTCCAWSCVPAHSSLPEAAVGLITAHGALHEPAQWSWILGPGAGSASGAPLKSTELRNCGPSCSSALRKLCDLQPGEQPFPHGALPVFLQLPRGWGSICLPKKLCMCTAEVSPGAVLGEILFS